MRLYKRTKIGYYQERAQNMFRSLLAGSIAQCLPVSYIFLASKM